MQTIMIIGIDIILQIILFIIKFSNFQAVIFLVLIIP